MARILVQPSGVEFEAGIGDTIMDAAHAAGFYWPTTCGGQAICTTCLSEIVEGGEALADMGRSERKTLVEERGEAILKRNVRLACQATVLINTAITVNKPGVVSVSAD
jgi:2Fe-2S ferredoxin